MLAAVFFTTCQTVFSETPRPQSLSARQTHRNNGPLSISAAASHASSVFLTPGWHRNGSDVPALANKIHDSPAFLASLYAFQCQLREFPTTQPAAQQDRQNGSIALSCERLPVGKLPKSRRLARRQPIAQTGSQFANTFHAVDARGQLRA
jgi:hypothetical protein